MWKVLDTEVLYKTPFFQLKKEKCELPDKRVMPAYFVMDFTDWVMVVATNKEKQLILVEQYRHASKDMHIEFPGGAISKNESNSQAAGLRELQEETGYTSKDVEYVGYFYPNPALQSNKMHVYFAKDCSQTHDQNLDEFEELNVKTMPVEEFINLAQQGKVTHALMLSALALVKERLLGL